MTITAPPTRDLGGPVEPQRRRLFITVVAIAVLLAATAAWVLIDRAAEPEANVTSEIESLLDDYLLAWEEHDSEALRSIVTFDFVINEYFYQLAGERVFMTTHVNDDVDGVVNVGLDPSRQWRPEQVGDPVIVGDGPWFVSVAENWILEEDRGRSSNVRGDGVSTYVVVDDGGTLKIANQFWAGLEYRTGG